MAPTRTGVHVQGADFMAVHQGTGIARRLTHAYRRTRWSLPYEREHRMKVEIYSDVVCPWCYIGERRFARALSEFDGGDEVEVVFRPFQLDPDAPEVAVPHAEYIEKRFGRRAEGMHHSIDAAAEGEGISFAWDQALAANTRTAHRLLRLAHLEHGPAVQRGLAERLFDLHFSRGGNIADPEQLADEAAAAGMDRGRALEHLASQEGLQELDAAFQTARASGVRAVPTFVFDGQWVVEGAQSKEKFLDALEEVARTDAPTDAADAACRDGICEV